MVSQLVQRLEAFVYSLKVSVFDKTRDTCVCTHTLLQRDYRQCIWPPQGEPPRPFSVRGALGNILTNIVPNSHFGKRREARHMTISGSHVGPHIPNSGYLEVYEGI